MIKYILPLLSAFASVASAQENFAAVSKPPVTTERDSLFSHQLQLVDSISWFIRINLQLDIRDDFYTKWSHSPDGMYIFLYVSESDKIKLPDSLREKSLWSFDSEDDAIARSNELKKQGYHTLVYKTAGMSDARLSPKLLSYPDEAIAFILFHEAVHRHIHVGIDYMYTEALCDAVANAACIRFAKQTGMLDLKMVIKQQQIFEDAYSFLNKKRIEADAADIHQRPALFHRYASQINSLIRHGNQFQKDRMGYEVNNAYFLRVEPYALHYFEMKQQLGQNLEIDKVIAGLPPPKELTDTENTPPVLPDSIYQPLQWGIR